MTAPGIGRALGIHAESTVRPASGADGGGTRGSENGRESRGRRPKLGAERGTVHDLGLRRRYALQRLAGRLVGDKEERIDSDGRRYFHYRYRVAMCCRGMEGSGVWINASPDGQRAEFTGVQTCGSPHHCPVCAPKIAAKQVQQMNLAIHRWITLFDELPAGALPIARRAVYFMTFTNQHGRDRAGAGECAPAMRALAKALGYFKGTRAYRDAMKAAGSVGVIRALETSYGELNGWHHHTHEILFAGSGQLARDDDAQVVRWRSPLFRVARLWARTLIKFNLAGLAAGDTGVERWRKLRHLLRYCFDARDGSYAAEYVAKYGKEPEGERGGRWGLGSELAKAHLKGAAAGGAEVRRCSHASPWELLNDSLDGDARSGELWREYAIAFHGRAKLYWSRGLKARFEIPDVADIELARELDARCSVPVIELAPVQWRLILTHDARFDALRAAAVGGRDGVLALLAALERGPPGGDAGDFDQVYRYDGYRPGYALYQTPDGKQHKFWELPRG